MTKDKQRPTMGEMIAKAWEDEAFKRRLLADPMAVLGEEGVALPEGLAVKVVENTPQVFHLVIPPKPSAEALDDAQLGMVSGGGGCRYYCGMESCSCGLDSSA